MGLPSSTIGAKEDGKIEGTSEYDDAAAALFSSTADMMPFMVVGGEVSVLAAGLGVGTFRT